MDYSATCSSNQTLNKTESLEHTIPNNVTATLKWEEAGSYTTIYQSYKETSTSTNLYVDFDYDMADFYTAGIFTVELKLSADLEWKGSGGSCDTGTNKVEIPITKSMITEL